MLHAPLIHTVAKLDISRLLESSPSPQSRVTIPDAQQQAHPARSASDPPPGRPLPPGSGRSSISSTHSSSSSYAALSASSLPPLPPPPHLNRPYPPHRPRIPSLSALPIPKPSLPPVESLPRKSPHGHSTSAIPDNHTFPYPHPPKRPAPSEPHPSASPAKRQSKWTAEEDALVIELRGAGMKWEDISKRIPGRTPLSCRLHYQNYIERRSQWDEDRKNRLARLYERLKPEMWKPLAAELNVPWRAAEAMHWQLGQAEMARRAGVTPFSISGGPPGLAAGRLEMQPGENTPSAGYPPPSPYAGGYGSTAYPPSAMRQGYFDDREPAFKTPTYGRPRSISASSSSDDRRGSGSMPAGMSWSGPPSLAGNDRRFGSEWPLPRLPEVEDQAPLHHNAAGPPRKLSGSGP